MQAGLGGRCWPEAPAGDGSSGLRRAHLLGEARGNGRSGRQPCWQQESRQRLPNETALRGSSASYVLVPSGCRDKPQRLAQAHRLPAGCPQAVLRPEAAPVLLPLCLQGLSGPSSANGSSRAERGVGRDRPGQASPPGMAAIGTDRPLLPPGRGQGQIVRATLASLLPTPWQSTAAFLINSGSGQLKNGGVPRRSSTCHPIRRYPSSALIST